MSLQLMTAAASLTGPKSRNEDAWAVLAPQAADASRATLLVLADGVSQCADGQLAARRCVDALSGDFHRVPESWSPLQAIATIARSQHLYLSEQAPKAGWLTTLSALALQDNQMHLWHVGDCRLYLWRNKQWRCLSEDHSHVQPGLSHVLKQAMGNGAPLTPQMLSAELEAGDILLLASDGVWAYLKEAQLSPTELERNALQLWVKRLVSQALAQGGRDNATALAARVMALGEAQACRPALPLPGKLRVGDRLDGMEITAILQRGRTIQVCLAQHPEYGQVVLKSLLPDLADEARGRELLEQEQWLLQRMDGRHVPLIYRPRQSAFYLLMDYLEGETLAQRLAGGKLSVAQAIALGVRLSLLLESLESQQVFHRDIKPENLLYSVDGQLCLLDFGIATLAGDDGFNEPLAGTPSFLAPELYQGAEFTHRCDAYAAAVTLYLALTGRYPYGEIEPFQRPHFGEPVSARRWRSEVPAWLDELLLKALARDPAQRFASAKQWRQALEQGGIQRRDEPSEGPKGIHSELKSWQWIGVVSLFINLLLLVLIFF
ncbi:MAG: bifunctional protein-serine/threonine kinase/phosphatase [Aeromonadaceae bacterium]|nr:bifunctional protein-serine/threonine kinase/phosphatase [Aeromonadaceae bacterium]